MPHEGCKVACVQSWGGQVDEPVLRFSAPTRTGGSTSRATKRIDALKCPRSPPASPCFAAAGDGVAAGGLRSASQPPPWCAPRRSLEKTRHPMRGRVRPQRRPAMGEFRDAIFIRSEFSRQRGTLLEPGGSFELPDKLVRRAVSARRRAELAHGDVFLCFQPLVEHQGDMRFTDGNTGQI